MMETGTMEGGEEEGLLGVKVVKVRRGGESQESQTSAEQTAGLLQAHLEAHLERAAWYHCRHRLSLQISDSSLPHSSPR